MHKGYMIFSTALALFSLTMTSVGGLATSADGFASLEKRAVANLVTQVDRPNTFYRAITGPEKAYLASSYPEGGHPNIWRRTEGDFSATGAFYAFHELRHAENWGDVEQHDALGRAAKDLDWYLVEFHYQPAAARLKIKSFFSANDEWKNFVNGCNAGTCPTTFDIVEGPISINQGSKRAACMDAAGLVYQVAFTTPEALSTLTVTKVTKRTVPGTPKSWLQMCNIV